MRRFLSLLPAVLIAGCASLSPEQCRHADWRQIGFADGAGGASAARINDHAKACAEVGVKPDLDGYLRGREQGLVNYCRPENGFSVGRGGGASNAADCPEGMRLAFMDQYHRGQQIHFLESDLARRRQRIIDNNHRMRRDNERIARVREELRKNDLPDEPRKALLEEFERLVERKNAAGRENAFLIPDADRLQFHLQMKLREAGYWQ
ncbi:DUF2799 domain-containing protein [Noviherbaspirillum sp. ST9]|uniref:DUF2799 domain-containing protein n=1 Tax=Noviherbaspirillum sp. ST9 TaxID=3401606 RepID=UPI003B587C20